jgi:hypothetical protein
MSKQMQAIKDLLTTLKVNDTKYNIAMFSSPQLEDQYGEINLVKISLNNKEGMDLLVIPGYSFKSFTTMLTKLIEGMEYIENKYKNIYMINWGDKVKASTLTLGDGLPQDQKYIKQDEFRGKLAEVVDKLIRSPDMNLHNFTLLGKSAGAGVSFYLAAINTEVKVLMACCPGITNRGAVVANRLDLKIHLMWNKDDDVISYSIHEEIMGQLQGQGNDVTFYSYDDGGHELNVKFLDDTQ